MYFNIISDTGSRVTGYFVPDSFSGPSVIRIVHGRGKPILFPANEAIPALVAAGRHATGQCGFAFDETVVPHLPEIQNLEIHEPETGLRLYRRRPPGTIVQVKMFRLEMHLLPLSQLDEAFEPLFQYFYRGIEQLGQETAAQILLLNHAESSYASGRLLYKSYEHYIENNGFRMVCLLRDPYDELAERLLVLQRVGRAERGLLDARDSVMFEDAIEFATTLDLGDERQLRRAFRSMSVADSAIFSDPFVRTLTARSPDELAHDGSIGMALHILSNCAVVGLREHPQPFLSSLAELTGIEPARLPVPAEDPAVTALGRTLRQIGAVRSLIDCDLELYDQVKTALHQAL